MSLSQEIEALVKEAESVLSSATSEQDLDSLKNQFIGKKGKLTSVLKGLASLSVEEKKTVGKQANEAQSRLESFVETKRTSLKESFYENKLGQEFFDSLRPLDSKERGSLHPISQIQYEIEDIFTSMGFSVMDGPEVETDENNFGALLGGQ